MSKHFNPMNPSTGVYCEGCDSELLPEEIDPDAEKGENQYCDGCEHYLEKED